MPERELPPREISEWAIDYGAMVDIDYRPTPLARKVNEDWENSPWREFFKLEDEV
jgi:hypothetical protein